MSSRQSTCWLPLIAFTANTKTIRLKPERLQFGTTFHFDLKPAVKEIKIHPHWNPNDTKHEGDIAILEMDQAVQFSKFIQPVCLPVEPEISQSEAGNEVKSNFRFLVRFLVIFFINRSAGDEVSLQMDTKQFLDKF